MSLRQVAKVILLILRELCQAAEKVANNYWIMKRLYLTVIGASAIICGGCSTSEENIDLLTPQDEDLAKVSFNLPKLNPEQGDGEATRAYIWDGTQMRATWEETDSVGIFPERGDQLSYSMSGGAGSTSASFTGGSWGIKSTETYSSYYPFNRWNYFRDPSELVLDYTGQVQNGLDNADHITPYDYLVTPKTRAENGALTFDYQRIGFVMKLKLTVPVQGTYESLYLSANEPLFVTKVNLDVTTETPTLTPLTTSKTHKIQLQNFTTTTANQQVLVFLMCYPLNAQGKTFYVKLKSTSGHVFTASVSPSANYEANITRNITKTMTYDNSESISFGGEFTTEESEL